MGCASSVQAPDGVSAKAGSESGLVKKQRASDVYSFSKVLGKGASCKVVVGTHRRTNKKFAVKIIRKHERNHSDLEYLFKNEVKVLSTLNHPNIVEYAEAYEDDDTWNVVSWGGRVSFVSVWVGCVCERVGDVQLGGKGKVGKGERRLDG